MKKMLLFIFLFPCIAVNSTPMFDEDGNYAGNWKQMTNVGRSVSSQQRYSSSAYSTYNWKQQNKQNFSVNSKSFSVDKYNASATQPFRYNTLDYTRVRKVKGGHGEYNSRCTDIGDASFCQ